MPKLGKIKNYEFPNNITEVDNMTGREFEEFIANVYKYTEGYKIIELPGEDIRKDYGIDIVLQNHEGDLFGIQCKRYGANTKLNESKLNKMLNGAKKHKISKRDKSIDPDIADTHNLVLVTTGLEKQLSKRALEFIRRHQVEAYYRDDVIEFLKEVHTKQGKELKDYNYVNLAFEQTAKTGGSYSENSDFISFLKKERRKISKYNTIPVYEVFSNNTLKKIIEIKPVRLSELKAIDGFNEKKVSMFGQYLVNKIAKFLNQPIEELNETQFSDEELYEKLVVLRKELFKKYNQYFKAYHIYKNSTIHELIEKKPKTKEELLNIKSFGEVKVDQFGDEIIALFKGE